MYNFFVKEFGVTFIVFAFEYEILSTMKEVPN